MGFLEREAEEKRRLAQEALAEKELSRQRADQELALQYNPLYKRYGFKNSG